ncbi:MULTISPECIES: hypothetical protein [Salinibaculum]|uniref:hypothetical protein n=1 Tax=Salinibaculum TaxID=2732368 RepID=UPI0030D5AF8D
MPAEGIPHVGKRENRESMPEQIFHGRIGRPDDESESSMRPVLTGVFAGSSGGSDSVDTTRDRAPFAVARVTVDVDGEQNVHEEPATNRTVARE